MLHKFQLRTRYIDLSVVSRQALKLKTYKKINNVKHRLLLLLKLLKLVQNYKTNKHINDCFLLNPRKIALCTPQNLKYRTHIFGRHLRKY